VGRFVEWLKADGETVRPGEVLFRLEGEKASEEIESLDTGSLHIPANGPKTGDLLAGGAGIGYLLQPGETAPPAPERGPGVRPPSIGTTSVDAEREERHHSHHAVKQS